MRKILATVIAILVINLICITSSNAQQSNSEDKHLKSIKKQVLHQKRWAPEDPIAMKLNDGTKIKGYIAEILDDHFVITDRKGRDPISIDYGRVKKISVGGFGGNFKNTFALVIGGGVLALMAVCLIGRSCTD